MAKDRHKDSIVISVRVRNEKKARWKDEAEGMALSGFIEDAVDAFIELRRRKREAWSIENSKLAS